MNFKRTALDSKNIWSFTTVAHSFYSNKWSQTCICFCRHQLCANITQPFFCGTSRFSSSKPRCHGHNRSQLNLSVLTNMWFQWGQGKHCPSSELRSVHLAALIKSGTAAEENQWISNSPMPPNNSNHRAAKEGRKGGKTQSDHFEYWLLVVLTPVAPSVKIINSEIPSTQSWVSPLYITQLNRRSQNQEVEVSGKHKEGL